jgi:hypothetical protein
MRSAVPQARPGPIAADDRLVSEKHPKNLLRVRQVVALSQKPADAQASDSGSDKPARGPTNRKQAGMKD